MATIKITDQLGATVDAQVGSFSAWLAYARKAGEVLLSGATISQLQDLKTSAPAFQSFNTGLTFSNPVSLGTDAPELIIGANAGASFRIARRTQDDTLLFPADDLGENIEIPEGTSYAALGFNADLSTGASAGAQFTFGVTPGTSMAIVSYRPFPAGNDAASVLDALRLSIGEFVIPASAEDLNALPVGAVVTIKGSGRLTFSGSADLLAVANPLATATLPAPLPALSINQAASVGVEASWEISSEYQVRAHKYAEDRVRLAWYRTQETDFEVDASASAGLSTQVGKTDLFPKIIKAISADASPDLSAMPEEWQAECEQAVANAIDRRLQVALEGELGALQSHEAMFLYEVDCAALDEAGKAAIAGALAGGLGGLAEVPGVREVKTVRSKLTESRLALKINLLGIFNYGSMSKLALESKVTFTPSTGDLVFLDSASAARVQSASTNFGPDEDKLRALMAECFLITAAYRGGELVSAPPELASSHMFFRLRAKTGSKDLREAEVIAEALGLHGPAIPAGINDFGRTAILAETRYDDKLTRALFLHPDGAPRLYAEYEGAGRRAIQLLVPEGRDDRYRRIPAVDDTLWARMKDLGPANFRQLFPETQAPVVAADYLAIEWWADTMSRTGSILARIAREPELRSELARGLRDVADKAHDQFGQPWGLVSMFLVSGSTAPAEVRVTGKRFAFAAG